MDYLEPEDQRDNIFRSSGKFELLDRILPKLIQTGHKILIFSQFTQLMDIMQIFFDYKGIKHLRLDGGTKHEDRAKNLQIFNDHDCEEKVFLLSTRAGGHGLNLQVSDTVIIFDSDWNPQMDEQAKDRAHRIGQQREVRVYRLITSTKIEEGIFNKATMKKDLDNKIIQAGMFNDKASDMERQKRLEDLIRKDYADDEEGEQESEIPTDDQINEIISRSAEEYELFTRLDQERYIVEGRDRRVQEIFNFMEKEHAKRGVPMPHINPANINYRLTQDWEVPDWIRTKPEDPDKLVIDFGSGKRQRKQINYNEEFSEAQFLKIIEQGGDPAQEAEKLRKRRQDGADGFDGDLQKRRKLDHYIDPDSSQSESESQSEGYKGATKKKAAVKQDAAEEQDELIYSDN